MQILGQVGSLLTQSLLQLSPLHPSNCFWLMPFTVQPWIYYRSTE